MEIDTRLREPGWYQATLNRHRFLKTPRADLALTLLVFRVLLVDHVEASFAANDLVFRTALLYARSYFHGLLLNWRRVFAMIAPGKARVMALKKAGGRWHVTA